MKSNSYWAKSESTLVSTKRLFRITRNLFFSLYNVRKNVRYPVLISRQPADSLLVI